MATFRKKYIATPTFYKHALKVAIPLMLQQFLTSSVNILDNLLIALLGDEALSGMAATNRFVMIAMFAIMGFMSASTVYIAQYFGAKNEEKMRETFRISIFGAFSIAIPFFLIGTIFARPIMEFLISSGDATTVDYGVGCLQVIAWTLLPLGITMPIANSLRAIGHVKAPMRASMISIVINMTFDYLLIFGNFGFPKLGILGGSLSTLLARIVEAIILLVVLKRGNYAFKTKVKDLLHFPKSLLITIIRKGIPLVVNEILWSSGMTMLFTFYSTRGVEVSSGYAIAGSTSDLFFTLFGGMSVATTVLVSQPLGADNLEEAKQNAYWLLSFSIFMAIIFGMLIYLSSFIVPYLYSGVSLEARTVAINCLTIMACLFFIYMANAECYFIIRSGGDMRSTFFMDSGFMWCVNLPVVAAFTYLTDWPIYYIYIAGQVTDFLKFAVSFWMVRREKWVRNLTRLEHN